MILQICRWKFIFEAAGMVGSLLNLLSGMDELIVPALFQKSA
jgi:hypothetical protein